MMPPTLLCRPPQDFANGANLPFHHGASNPSYLHCFYTALTILGSDLAGADCSSAISREMIHGNLEKCWLHPCNGQSIIDHADCHAIFCSKGFGPMARACQSSSSGLCFFDSARSSCPQPHAWHQVSSTHLQQFSIDTIVGWFGLITPIKIHKADISDSSLFSYILNESESSLQPARTVTSCFFYIVL